MATALLSSGLCGLGFTQFAKKSGEIGVLGERRYAYDRPPTPTSCISLKLKGKTEDKWLSFGFLDYVQ